MQATYPEHWKFESKSGAAAGLSDEILCGASFVAVVAGDDVPADLARVDRIVTESDWGPMVRSVSNIDLMVGNRQALVLEMLSESDSLDFLNVRMNTAITSLSETLEAADFEVVAAATEFEAVSLASGIAIQDRQAERLAMAQR